MEHLYKITEITKKYGITTRTLRWYEEIGLIESVRIPDYSYRMYTDETVRRLEQILYFRKMDISLEDIATILSSSSANAIDSVLTTKQTKIDRQVEHLSLLKENVLSNLAATSYSNEKLENLISSYKTKEEIKINNDELFWAVSEDVENRWKPYDAQHNRVRFVNDCLVYDGHGQCAETEEKFSSPITFKLTVKTDNSNMHFYFGLFTLSFYAPNKFVLSESSNRINIRFHAGRKLKKDEYINIRWCIERDHISCKIEDEVCLDYHFVQSAFVPSIEEIKNTPFGFGADVGNRVTVKSVKIFTGKKRSEYSLKKVYATGNKYEIHDGVLAVTNFDDALMLRTERSFKLPMMVVAEARLSTENLRLYFKKGKIILGWEKKALCIDDVFTGARVTMGHLGMITPDVYHTIRLLLTEDVYALEIDGMVELALYGTPYMKAMKRGETLESPIGICSAFSNTVTLKKMSIIPLEKII